LSGKAAVGVFFFFVSPADDGFVDGLSLIMDPLKTKPRQALQIPFLLPRSKKRHVNDF
jgi:hypothetical protein